MCKFTNQSILLVQTTLFMKNALIFLFIFSFFNQDVFSQSSLRDARKKSYKTYLYNIPADTAEKYLKHGITDIDHYLLQEPVMSFHADSVNYDKIPVGNYLLVSVQDSMIEAKYYCSTGVLPYVVNNQVKPQLIIRNEKGESYSHATVWVNNRLAKYSEAANTFVIDNKKPDGLFVRIEVPGDTSFTELTVERENYTTVKKQVSARFRSSKAGKILSWLPGKLKKCFAKKNYYSHRKNKKNNYRAEGKGYVLLSKPKYFPSDTIKFKAYLLDKKGRQYRQTVDVFLNYYNISSNVSRKLVSLKPVTPGAFVYEFATGDTLPNDTRFTLQFRNRKEKIILNGQFKIEDYLLDEVASYTISSRNEKYYTGDTLQFTASAKDANGLALMDGRVKLVLLANNISSFYKERVFVPDTIWQQEKQLAIEGDTKFRIPTDSFPDADFEMTAKAIFRNSNNEMQEKETEIKYFASDTKIDIKLEDGLIKAVLYKNGKSVEMKGFMETDLTTDSIPIKFPYEGKVDPQAESYEFYTADGEAIDEWEDFDVPGNYNVTFSRFQQLDTVAFVLSNPNKVPVYYSLFDKDKEIFSASSSDENIIWKDKIPGNKIYYLRWQYYWAGKEKYNNENIALLSKLGSTEIGGATTVYPGQTDTITVRVKDYRKRELGKVNLTAVSYNSQFTKDIYVPEPPYIQKFKGKQPILHDWFETDDVATKKSFSLGKHPGWRKQFNLDTMPYYQFLFPGKYYHMVKSRIQEVLPQVSVYAVQNGVPQEIYLLYINRQLVYYNGVTDKSVYAVSQYPGYAKISIRLKDKFVEADSIYLQPYYKHDIVFDIDKKAKDYSVTDTANYWTWQEKDLLDRYILRVENNYRNNNGYVWQNDKAYYLGSNGEHIVGPFTIYEDIQFYKPGDFDFKFIFEPGYRYRVSPQVVRLEKIPLISQKDKVLLSPKGVWWPLGDTLVDLPVISYEKKKIAVPFLVQEGSNYSSYGIKNSRIKLQLPFDSSFAFTILQNNNATSDYRVMWGKVEMLYNISKGNYTVVMVTSNFRYLAATNIVVESFGAYCVKFEKPVYAISNEIVKKILELQEQARLAREQQRISNNNEQENKDKLYRQPEMKMVPGTGTVYGKFVDAKGGDIIPSGSVIVKGYKYGTMSKPDGTFTLSNLSSGKYILLFAAVGYTTVEMEVTVIDGEKTMINPVMLASSMMAQEVVVTAYGIAKKKSELGYSVTTVSSENLTQALAGKVSGLQIRSQSAAKLGNSGSGLIRLRGEAGLSSGSEPIYIVDGTILPNINDLKNDDIADISFLKGSEAVAIYGSTAANGAIIITTKGFNPKMMREEFRDYAFWKPNLITDENGEAKFTVTYPDNITSWQTYVVGMDKQHRITKASKLVKAFKPMLAQLSAPQFLIDGDSAVAIGKKINYTTSDLNVKVDFSLNGKQQLSSVETVKGNDATISELGIVANPGVDTITARFSMKADNGFADGEQRKIPVLRKGTMETTGQFNILEGDTIITVETKANAGSIKIYAQNNTFDLLLDEIEYLKNYPYYCMEQTASKLTGFAMEKKIREALKQDFTNEKEMNKLLSKLQKGQLFDGSWGWWEGSGANITITNYITRALLQLRGEALLETNIRNALLFLSNQLPKMNRHDLLETLYTLNEAGHDMDYNVFLKRLVFDSLTQHQQWQMLSVLQKQKLSYENELQTLLKKKTATMPGGLHWGENCYWWNRNEMATTVLAYKTLGRIPGYDKEQKQITQYFLEKRKEGHWQNTVESATVLSALLPDVLKSNQNFTAKASLVITGDTTFTVNKFPFAVTLKPGAKNITATKQGGGMVYFTAYQQVFNTAPLAVDINFRIRSYFESGSKIISSLKAGEKVKMKVEVNALKDADYVQLEIPIPAGCTYGYKSNGSWYEHREYFRDRVLIFIEKMSKGSYTYEIELEPRYNGKYTINPAKAELMYFPVFYGRDEIKRVEIKKD